MRVIRSLFDLVDMLLIQCSSLCSRMVNFWRWSFQRAAQAFTAEHGCPHIPAATILYSQLDFRNPSLSTRVNWVFFRFVASAYLKRCMILSTLPKLSHIPAIYSSVYHLNRTVNIPRLILHLCAYTPWLAPAFDSVFSSRFGLCNLCARDDHVGLAWDDHVGQKSEK